MEHATFAAPRAVEQHTRAEELDNLCVLRVGTAHGVLTSTQIEAVADTADLSGTRVELTSPGDLVLQGVRQHDAARIAAALAQAGLRLESAAGAAAGEQARAAPGLQHVELSVPDGRITSRQLRELARLARTYADCELRVTPARNLVILNMPRANLALMLREPVLRELRPA